MLKLKIIKSKFLIDKNISNKIVSQSKLSNKEIRNRSRLWFMTDIILQKLKQIILVEKIII